MVSGTVDVVVQVGGQGNQLKPVTYMAGELIMISALFAEMPVHTDLVAKDDVSLRWIPLADLEHSVLQSRENLELLVRYLAQRLREVQVRERGWLERDVPERVRTLLVRALRETAENVDGRPMLVTTHEYLASQCGLSRPRLSIELKRLEQTGRIRLRRASIEILLPDYFVAAD